MTEQVIASTASNAWTAIGQVFSAHIEMIRGVGLIDDDAAATLISAVERVREAPPPSGPLLPLIAVFDERLEAAVPRGLSGVARVGRGSVDVAAAVARMLLRDELHALSVATNELRSVLIELAETHVTTLMPAFVDGRVSQPTTLGHRLTAVVSPLARAAAQLEAAYALMNRSPLGSGSGASTGMPTDRDRLVDLLGFDGLIESTLDAVSAVDHFIACAEAADAVVLPIRRFIAELIGWTAIEPGSVRFGDSWAEFDAAHPHANPFSGLARLLGGCNAVSATVAAVRTTVASHAFGPVTGALDVLLDMTLAAIGPARSHVEDMTRLVQDGFEVSRALLANRAGKGLSTSADLADFLMIEEQIEPGAAQQIAALTVARAREQGLEASAITVDMIDGVALLVIGREVKVEFEAISRYLAPRRFIERRNAPGGPAPSSVRALLEGERAALARDRQWWSAASERLTAATAELVRIEEAARTAAAG